VTRRVSVSGSAGVSFSCGLATSEMRPSLGQGNACGLLGDAAAVHTARAAGAVRAKIIRPDVRRSSRWTACKGGRPTSATRSALNVL